MHNSSVRKISSKTELLEDDLHPMISVTGKRYYVAIPINLSKSLKKAVPAARFCPSTTRWYISSKSLTFQGQEARKIQPISLRHLNNWLITNEIKLMAQSDD